ncbi:copper chaperone PCu(A)C [Devosia soli]|nr:copper chaperone PCu(A)C [Devosia soli]
MTLRSSLFALVSALTLTVAAPVIAHEGHQHTDDAAQTEHSGCDAVTVGDLEISGPFTRATLPNAPVGGGFLTIKNTGTEDDRLISATSTIAKDTQIHEMAMEGDVMKMRQLVDGLAIPAGETVTLEPGGNHIMFMGLNGPIKEGEKVSVTLTFEKAGEVTLDLVAAGAAADAPAHDHGSMAH